jgi:hypothetical protein
MGNLKIVAIGSSPSDLETGCFGTLSKFINKGHQVSLIIASRKSAWSNKMISSFNEFWKKVGVSEILFTEKFDHSVVTQENVQVLRSFLEPIHPELVFLPSPQGTDKVRVTLGRSSLLACRGIGNILMYESGMNSNFSPGIYSVVDDSNQIKKKHFVQNKRNIHGNKTSREIQELRKKYAKYVGSGTTLVEVFDSNRILLLNNDIF